MSLQLRNMQTAYISRKRLETPKNVSWSCCWWSLIKEIGISKHIPLCLRSNVKSLLTIFRSARTKQETDILLGLEQKPAIHLFSSSSNPSDNSKYSLWQKKILLAVIPPAWPKQHCYSPSRAVLRISWLSAYVWGSLVPEGQLGSLPQSWVSASGKHRF